MIVDVDSSYAEVVTRLHVGLRDYARELPRRLGWERWSEYATLEPFRELPVFAAEAPGVPGTFSIDEGDLEAFRVAHYRGGFWGVTVDHLCDGQVEDTAELRELIPELHGAWREALAAATGDAAASLFLVDEARALHEAGVELEYQAFRRGQSTIRNYRVLVHLKTQWLTLPARVLLARSQPADLARQADFARACELLLLASQCLDDALDAEQDARGRHSSYPTLLRVSPVSLASAAPALLYRAAETAHSGKFHGLSRWLAHHAEVVERSLSTNRRKLADRMRVWLLVADLLGEDAGSSVAYGSSCVEE